MRKLIRKLFIFINSLLYPNYNIEDSLLSQIIILKLGIIQKIFGINRHVPWVVHFTSIIRYPEKIKFHKGIPVGYSKYSYFDARNGIILGENVLLAPGISLISMSHNTNNYEEYSISNPIVIGNNSWIAKNAIILPGVELGEHTIVAAGAVVSKSFPEGNQVLAGNPARIVKKLGEYLG